MRIGLGMNDFGFGENREEIRGRGGAVVVFVDEQAGGLETAQQARRTGRVRVRQVGHDDQVPGFDSSVELFEAAGDRLERQALILSYSPDLNNGGSIGIEARDGPPLAGEEKG